MRNSRSNMKTLVEIKKKKHVLLRDEVPNSFQIWMAVSLLDEKGNKAIKKNFVFLSNWSVYSNTVTYSASSLLSKKITDFYHFVIFLCRYKGSEVTAMIFITIMHQFNVIIHVKRVFVVMRLILVVMLT